MEGVKSPTLRLKERTISFRTYLMTDFCFVTVEGVFILLQ